MRRNNTSFAKYCNKRLSNSLITGVPKITNAKNSKRKCFKLIVFFLSVIGFLWQTYTFLEIYLKYPVVQEVTTEYPEVFAAPAVTLCNRNRIKRQPFCRSLPDKCYNGFYIWEYEADLDDYFYDEVVTDEEAQWETICKEYRKYCVAVKPENYEVRFPSLESSSFMNLTNEFLQALGPQSQQDLLEKCTIERSGQSITCNDSIMIQVPHQETPYKCFTFFSLIDEPNKDPENFSLSDYYTFRLNLHPEEDINWNTDDTYVYVSVHDSRRSKSPFVERKSFQSGYSHRLYVTMQHRQNLPPPYETNCVDYLALWKKNGGRGPLSKQDCIQFCMIDEMMDKHGCIHYAIKYPTNVPICSKSPENVLKKIMKLCEYSCHPGCEETDYFLSNYEIIDNIQYKLCNETDLHCQLSYVDLEINFNRMTVERLKSEPTFRGYTMEFISITDYGSKLLKSEELSSHIGGYMGLWLGISFITLFDLIEMLLDIIMYPMIKWKRMKTRIVNISDDKHNV